MSNETNTQEIVNQVKRNPQMQENLAADVQTKREIYAYLDSLKETGGINIMRVKNYLRRELSLTEQQARQYLFGWIQNLCPTPQHM